MSRRRLLWVIGCRSDYVGSASGVPDIADHLLHPRKSAALGQLETNGIAAKIANSILVGTARASKAGHAH
jgi:hypothetical protein